ncbi:MAG: PAS domain S-box protein [Candidatus Eisenbacteria bacterium]
MSAILDAAVDGIVVIDRQGIMLEFNHAAESIFGFTRAEAIGQGDLTDTQCPIRIRPTTTSTSTSIESKSPRIIGIGREVAGRRKDGSVFPLDLAVNEITLGNEINFVRICRDITEAGPKHPVARGEPETALRVVGRTRRSPRRCATSRAGSSGSTRRPSTSGGSIAIGSSAPRSTN